MQKMREKEQILEPFSSFFFLSWSFYVLDDFHALGDMERNGRCGGACSMELDLWVELGFAS